MFHTPPATQGAILQLSIEQDNYAENPMTSCDGSWTLYSFKRRDSQYRNPSGFVTGDTGWIEGGYLLLGMRNKLRAGTAFMLHGGSDSQSTNWGTADYQGGKGFDIVDYTGILVWEHPTNDMGAKTWADRRKNAEAEIKTYNAWANGECFWFGLEDANGESVDSCGGFIGYGMSKNGMSEYLIPSIAAYAREHGCTEILCLNMGQRDMSNITEELDDEETPEVGTLLVAMSEDTDSFLGYYDIKMIENCLTTAPKGV